MFKIFHFNSNFVLDIICLKTASLAKSDIQCFNGCYMWRVRIMFIEKFACLDVAIHGLHACSNFSGRVKAVIKIFCCETSTNWIKSPLLKVLVVSYVKLVWSILIMHFVILIFNKNMQKRLNIICTILLTENRIMIEDPWVTNTNVILKQGCIAEVFNFSSHYTLWNSKCISHTVLIFLFYQDWGHWECHKFVFLTSQFINCTFCNPLPPPSPYLSIKYFVENLYFMLSAYTCMWLWQLLSFTLHLPVKLPALTKNLYLGA
jgi:hypothetical protein